MTTEKSPAQIEAEARASRRSFSDAWTNNLKAKATEFDSLPIDAFVYEIAWHAFRAGIDSWNNKKEAGFPPLEKWVPLKFRFGSWNHCFYCGEFPESQDHVVPRSMMRSWLDLHPGDSPGPKTPACNHCNTVLSDHFFDTLHERCEAIRERLLKRFGRDAARPDWTAEELASLDAKLRKHVCAKQEQKAIHKRRIEWQSGEKFAAMFNDAHNSARIEFPENEEFQRFMEPKWRK